MSTPTKNPVRRRAKWIGLIHVRPIAGNRALGDAKGAYVTCVALAKSAYDFGRVAADALPEHDFQAIEIEDVELFTRRARNRKVAPEIIKLSEYLSAHNRAAL